MSFEIVAERESQTVRMRKDSSLIAIANARVWASEGWTVTVIVSDEAVPPLLEDYTPSLQAISHLADEGDSSGLDREFQPPESSATSAH